MKLLLTKELGRLAKWLRILGFDVEYFSENKASSLMIKALREDRAVITRNHRLPASRGVRIITIESEILKEQIPEVLKGLKIKPDQAAMFTRCIICNVELAEIEKEKVKDKVPEYVFKTQEGFITCPKCQRIYWAGTHWGNVQQTLDEIK
jgi:uncharacterized protein with PIN domain